MFLDNVTTIVLIAPVSIHIADTLGIRVIPLLMAEALLSDTGGVAKLVRDPPNIIIGSAAGFSFNDFLTHALPLTLVAWVAALIVLLIVFRRDRHKEPENIDDLMRMRAADAIHDPASLRKILIVFGFVVALFSRMTRCTFRRRSSRWRELRPACCGCGRISSARLTAWSGASCCSLPACS